MDQEKLGEKSMGIERSKQTRQRIVKMKTEEPKRGKENNQGKYLRRKL